MKYVIWNNKGGVGKSFLSFVLATEYALTHPEKQVCVIDMCPQANVSEILLGGNGEGYKNLSKVLNENNRQTIGGYFDKRLSRPDEKLGDESSYIIKTHDYAENIPENLYLVCGDPSLELQVQSINQIASVDLPETRWANVHKWLLDLQTGISSKYNENVVYFIDCNPSFATYTAQAIIAADRIIAPCTADGSSARAIDNVGQLLYGVGLNSMYSKTNFAYKAKENRIDLPSLFLIILNRHTTSKNAPSSAFKAMYAEIKRRVDELKSFCVPRVDTFHNIPDAHAVSIVACEKATPVSQLKPRSYALQHGSTQVNADPLTRYQESIKKVVALL